MRTETTLKIIGATIGYISAAIVASIASYPSGSLELGFGLLIMIGIAVWGSRVTAKNFMREDRFFTLLDRGYDVREAHEMAKKKFGE